jgi:hypothetical protein
VVTIVSAMANRVKASPKAITAMMPATIQNAARRYRTVKIKAGRQILTAADPLPDDLREAITQIGGQLEH